MQERLSPLNLEAIKEPGPLPILPDRKADLEKKALESQYERDEITKKHLNKVFIFFIWIAFIAFILVFFIRVLHFVLPDDIQWLSAEQIQGIDKLIFSGTIGGFIGRYFKRYDNT